MNLSQLFTTDHPLDITVKLEARDATDAARIAAAGKQMAALAEELKQAKEQGCSTAAAKARKFLRVALEGAPSDPIMMKDFWKENWAAFRKHILRYVEECHSLTNGDIPEYGKSLVTHTDAGWNFISQLFSPTESIRATAYNTLMNPPLVKEVRR